MKAQINIGSITMPAGEYWVGDPCYAVPGDRWMEWLNAADYKNADRYLLAELDGRAVLGVETAYGDGEYRGSDGNSYPVDAGLLGVTPVEISDNNSPALSQKPFGSQRVVFEKPFECSYSNGTITIGHIVIETDEA